MLDREWERRLEEISRTRRIKFRDVLTITTLTLNREVGEVTHEVEGLRKEVEGLKTEIDILAGEVREERKENATKNELTREVSGLRELHMKLKRHFDVLKWMIIGFSALTFTVITISIGRIGKNCEG